MLKKTFVFSLLLTIFSSTISYSQESWVNFTISSTRRGLANNNVYSIAIDSEGNKWFGTWVGVSKFDGTNWTAYTSGGLALNTVNAITIDSYGNKWFGTFAGVNFLGDPATVQIE